MALSQNKAKVTDLLFPTKWQTEVFAAEFAAAGAH
jgi:hypothetical protein